MSSKEDFKKDINTLKSIFKVFNYEDLAEKLNISESAIKGWSKRKTIPKKYKKYIENNINGNVMGNVITNTNGDINIGHNNNTDRENELIKIYRELDEKQQEYFFFAMKAEHLKKQM